MRWGAIVAVGLWLGCEGAGPTERVEATGPADRSAVSAAASPASPAASPSPAASASPIAPAAAGAELAASATTASVAPAGSAEPGYALGPLLDSLRPALREAHVTKDADRLPLYELDMDVEDTTFALRETLWFTNDEAAPLPEVVLRVYANALGPRVRVLDARCLGEPACRVEQVSGSTLKVVPQAPLPPGGRIRVQLELGGALEVIDASRLDLLAQGMEGLATLGSHGGGGDYGLLAVGEGVRSFANFYAVLARRDAAGWQLDDASTLGDLGSDRLAHVRLRLVLPLQMRAVSSGVMVGAPRQLPGGKRVEEYAAGFVRDVSVLVSDRLQVLEAQVGDVRVRSHFLADDRVAGGRVLEVARGALELFERSFGPYPYADFDLVEAPLVGGAGGVEFSGLVTVASMFYRKPGSRTPGGFPGLAAQQPLFDAMLELVTAHEVAHQYWHGLVGSDSRDDPFLDEGLAQFSALLYVEAVHGKERAALEADRQVAANYRLMRTLGIGDAAVLQPVAAFQGAVQYAGLVYGKGPLGYRAMRDAIGDKALFAVLREYTRDWAFRVAPRGALRATFARAGHAARIDPLWRRWLEERHGDEDLGTDVGLANLLGSGADAPNLLGSGADAPNLPDVLKALDVDQAATGSEELPSLEALEQLLGATTHERDVMPQPSQ